jgi:hypothetical protein
MFIIFWHQSIFPAAAIDKEIDPNKRALLIFLDDDEAYSSRPVTDDPRKQEACLGGPISSALLAAIITKAGFLLVSGPLLYNILSLPLRDAQKDTEFIKAVENQFDYSSWAIKRVNQESDLYCMIPKKYLEDARDLQYKLGLRLDSMEPIPMSNYDELRTYFAEKYAKRGNGNLGTDLIKNLNNIFVTNSEYPEDGSIMPQWSIYLGGHGSYGTMIALLTLKEFDAFLNFLDKKIKTIFFAYFSCYAAGYNAEQIYGELTKKGGAATYPFIIVGGALSDNVTIGECNRFIDSIIDPLYRFDLFVNTLLRVVVPYKEVLAYIFPAVVFRRYSSLVMGIPQIRFPHSPTWFPVTDIDKAVVSITKTMAKARHEPLVIKPYDAEGVKHEPAAILLYAHQVPFSLHIETTDMPPLVSMTGGKADHLIKEIIAKNIDTKYFFWTQAGVKYGVEKCIFIEKLETKDGYLSNVLIYFEPNKWNKAALMKYKYSLFDRATNSIKKFVGVDQQRKKPIVSEEDYTVPHEYRSINWSVDTSVRELMSKKGEFIRKKGSIVKNANDISDHNDLAKQFAAAYVFKKKRMSVATFFISLLLSNKELGYAGRRAVRYLLQKVEAKESHALDYLQRILQAMMADKMDEAIVLVNEAYGKSKPIGSDFKPKEFEQKKWHTVLFSVLGDSRFDFLDEFDLGRLSQF